MKKLFTVLALLSLAIVSRATITGSYDSTTKTLTVNYVNDATSFWDDAINVSSLDNLGLSASSVDKIVFTGDWANANCQKLGDIVGKYASQNDPVYVDLTACTKFESKFVSVQDNYDQSQGGYDKVNTVFTFEPNGWTPAFNLDKCRENHKLSGISFPKSDKFTFIPDNLLISSQNLKKVVIPEGVVAIGNNAFGGSPIEDLTLPTTITEIGGGAFKEAKITALDLSKMKLSKVRAESFLDCTQLASVKFPTTITEIQRMAFQRTPVVIVDLSQCHNLRLLAYQCFSECTSLDSVIVCSHEKVIRGSNSIDPNGYHAGGGAFYNARYIKVVEIKYCKGTDVTKCWCENAAFDYDVTHVQTRLDRIPEAAKLIYPKGDNASAPYTSNFDFFVGNYKAGAVIRQSNLLKFWRYIPARGQNVAELPDWLDKSTLNNYIGNGWLEFLSTGDGEIVDEGEFLRTYSRTIGEGAVLLPDIITAYRAIDYESTAWDYVADKNGEWVLINEDDPNEGYKLKDRSDAGKTTYAKLTIGGQLLLRPLRPLKNGQEVESLSYIPENTGVVLYSNCIDEESFLVFDAYRGNEYDLSREYPHTGDRYEAGRLSFEDDDINMLEGSYGDDCPVAPVSPWHYANEQKYTGGYYVPNEREYRNFGFNKSAMKWRRLTPGLLRLNRAYAHIPIGRFNNYNETSDQMPDFTLEDHITEPTDHMVVLASMFEDDTNGIKTINNSKNFEKDAWYTLQGVKVSKPAQGVYIHNNKTVVIK